MLQRIQDAARRLFRGLRRSSSTTSVTSQATPTLREGARIIGVLNYKGGTGKTTTVVNLAAGLTARGARVLCVDLDAQGGLATNLNVSSPYTLSHLLMGQKKVDECIIRARDNLDLITSDRTLLEAEMELWRLGKKGRYLLAKKLEKVRGYDYVLLDFSPSVNLVGECGLFYSHDIIVPVAMDYMALVGIRQVVETIKQINQHTEHKVRLLMVVPTFYDERQRLDREVMDLLQKYFPGKIAEPVRANIKLSEAPSHGMTIFEYSPRSMGAKDYMRLVEKVASND